MRATELIEKLKKYPDLPVYYVNEEKGYNEEVIEIEIETDHKKHIVLGREGCFR